MTQPSADRAKASHRRRLVVLAGAVIAGALAGLAGVYGIGGLQRNAQTDPECQPAVEVAKKIEPFAHGEVAAVNVAEKPLRVPRLEFTDAEGGKHSLDDWRGRTVLLNLWATWCVPCRKEMPA